MANAIRILFGVSDTEECRKAIPSIIKLFARRSEIELTLLHVTPETIVLAESGPIDIVLEIAHEYDLLVIGASESSMLHRIFNSHQNSFINSSPIPVLVAK